MNRRIHGVDDADYERTMERTCRTLLSTSSWLMVGGFVSVAFGLAMLHAERAYSEGVPGYVWAVVLAAVCWIGSVICHGLMRYVRSDLDRTMNRGRRD